MQQFLTYKDPNGRFSIDYPDSWKSNPVQDNSSSVAVTFTSGLPSSLPTHNLTGLPNSFSELDILISLGIIHGDLEKMANISMDIVGADPAIEMKQAIECSKYSFGGNKACSTIFTRTLSHGTSQIKIEEMDIITIVNSKGYFFKYEAPQDNFSTDLPTIDKMINSFKIAM